MSILIKSKEFFLNVANKNIYTTSLYLRRVASAVIVFCLARYLTVETYGLYSSYANIAGILLLITNFGFNEYILVSSKSEVKQVRLKLSFFLLLANILVCLILICSNCVPLDNKRIFSLVIIRNFLDSTFFALILTYYQASHKFNIISTINIIYSISLILIVLFCYRYQLTLDIFLMMCIAIGLTNYLYSYLTAKLNFTMVIKHLKKYIKMIDKQLIYYGLVMVTVLLYYQLPSLYVSVFIDKTSAAIYFAAFNIFSILLLISSSQVQQIMPDMIKANNNEIKTLITKNILYISIINIAILIFFIFFGKWLLSLLYGKPEYQMSYQLLIIGAFGNLFMSAGGILACFMTAKGFQKKKFQYQIECLFVVASLIFLLRDLGITGAVCAYCLISIYVFIRYLIFTLIQIKRINFEK